MILRIPASEFPSRPFQDQDIIDAYDWFMSFISEKEWLKRKEKIENCISVIFKPAPSLVDIREGTLIAIREDQIGWYLYLVYVLQYEPYKYDYWQGARILPIFKRIGMNLDLVKAIDGIEKKVKHLLRKRPSEADSILFEILTALLWARNGWKVKILEERQSGKTPDLEVSKDEETWQVECKRQKKTSDYTYRETAKRQIMISHISNILMQHNVLLDIKFHVELVSLPDTYLKEMLETIIPIAKNPGKLLSTKEMDVDISFVNIKRIRRHLQNYYVKNPSPQLIELIANGTIDSCSSFTSGAMGDYCYVGDGEANNMYLSDISNAFGVTCSCDAEESVRAKAKDIKNQIRDAIGQFSLDTNGIIHIGIETLDGPFVEKERTGKIKNTLKEFDPQNNKLRWIYIHFFQTYSRSYEDWIIDETVDFASAYINPIPPLEHTYLIIPEEESSMKDGPHWLRELP